MSKEWMIKTLVNLAFTKTDAQVYVYLATKGSQKTKDIRDSLKISRRKLYRILKNLQSIGIVEASSEYPTRFSTIPFEKVLDLLIKDKMKQQQILEDSKDELLSTWQKIMRKSKK